jgi:Dyp-type peroxidase, N-terminal
MAASQLVGEESDPSAPPVDTGETVGSPVSRLTVTIGYGPALFDDRFGGLFFIAFMKNPSQFVRLQTALAGGRPGWHAPRPFGWNSAASAAAVITRRSPAPRRRCAGHSPGTASWNRYDAD